MRRVTKAPGAGRRRNSAALLRRAAALALCWLVLVPLPAQAYLDPGTGSMLVSALIGIAATLFFLAKSFYYKATGLVYRIRGGTPPHSGADGIVLYSEGRQYWGTFKPVLEALDAMGEKALYLTSDDKDPGLAHGFAHVRARCIGQGNRAFATLNMLEAGLCATTTPGLDVLQIRRSPGVACYAYIQHSPTDAALYKLYAFDWFDAILCSGPHQMRSLRALEDLRGTPKKALLRTGCPYMDELAGELALHLAAELAAGPTAGQGAGQGVEQGTAQGTPSADAACGPRVLLAPTWGKNGLLSRFGAELIEPMLKAGMRVTVRPHPQSRSSEPELLDQLATALAEYPNLAWDHETSALPAMLHSDVLVSEFSGIVFDYAFILERPVITVAVSMDTLGTEAADLPWPAWELEKLPELGASVRPEDIGRLPEVIAALPPQEEFSLRMSALRQESLYNFRRSGMAAARQLVKLRDAARDGGRDRRG